MENLNEKIKAYALKNAISYEGKANPGAVISALFNEGLEKSEVKNVMPKVQEIIKEISELNLDEMKNEFEKLKEFTSERKVREGLEELPNAENGVVMRFAPSPSGAMHIGHALTASLSYVYFKKYGGKFYFRIEDTNSDNIYEPAYKLLEEDANWLFENNCETFIQSDRMNTYYDYIVKLIKLGKVYVCECSGDDFREFAKNKKDCPCRNSSVEENLEKWEKMLDKNGYKSGEVVLRFKSSMQDLNPAMRDFPLARINESVHPRQKTKYRVWPLMNLAVTVDDIECGMTHIIRAKEHKDNAKRQKMIYEALGEPFPWTGFLGRWKFKDLVLSASQISQGVRDGTYSGWDDPKLPTLQTLKKKGYKPTAFHKIAEKRGLTEVDKVLDKKEFFRLLDLYNKE